MVQFLNDSVESLYRIEHDAACSCSTLTWLQYVTSEEFIEISERFLAYLQKHNIKKIINDSRQASHILLDSDQQWLVESYIPRLMAIGLRASAIIMPANRLIKLQVEDVVDEVEGATELIPTQYFTNLEDAKDWIAGF